MCTLGPNQLYQKYSKVQYGTALYFCKAAPNAAVFTVVFEVYINYFILKFNYNESDEMPVFDVIRNWINFRLRSFLYQGTLWQNIQTSFSYKLVSYYTYNNLQYTSLQFQKLKGTETRLSNNFEKLKRNFEKKVMTWFPFF